MGVRQWSSFVTVVVTHSCSAWSKYEKSPYSPRSHGVKIRVMSVGSSRFTDQRTSWAHQGRQETFAGSISFEFWEFWPGILRWAHCEYRGIYRTYISFFLRLYRRFRDCRVQRPVHISRAKKKCPLHRNPGIHDALFSKFGVKTPESRLTLTPRVKLWATRSKHGIRYSVFWK